MQLLFFICTQYSVWEITAVFAQKHFSSTEQAKVGSDDME